MKRSLILLLGTLLFLTGCKKEKEAVQTTIELTSLTYSGGSVHLSWSATNASAIISYTIQSSTNSFDFYLVQEVPAGLGNTFSHPVTVSDTYWYRVMATTADTTCISNVRRIEI